MKEHGILFKPEMIQAIEDGRKTMTRRIIKPQPKHVGYVNGINYDWVWKDLCFSEDGLRSLFPLAAAPYRPGDRLYVKEGFRATYDADLGTCVEYRLDGTLRKPEFPSEAIGWKWEQDSISVDCHRWSSPLFMPKWAARIWLEVTEVKVERVQEISENDACAEGVLPVTEPITEPNGLRHRAYRREYSYNFEKLWIKINGQQSWDANPWVWVYKFRRIER